MKQKFFSPHSFSSNLSFSFVVFFSCVFVFCFFVDCPSREVFLSLTDKFLECYLVGCQEYTIESRGDIGAWVREASMSGLQSVLVNLASIKPELIKETHVARAMKALAQQSVERIERTRAHAGKIFFSLLHKYDLCIPNFNFFSRRNTTYCFFVFVFS